MYNLPGGIEAAKAVIEQVIGIVRAGDALGGS
jgi:hypothetical protein